MENLKLNFERVLVTGAAGFVGSHTLSRLTKEGVECLGVDNFNDYYSPALKRARIKNFSIEERVRNLDLSDQESLSNLFESFRPQVVIHLAAQPGVRYSQINPNSYITNNVVAFESVIQSCRAFDVDRLLYASSSSVYGQEAGTSYIEENRGGPVKNLYALSKRFNEDRIALEQAFESVGLRFFSIYGPWGRPDMAYFRLIGSVLGLWRFKRLGDGEQLRDYTYVSDVVDAIWAILHLDQLPKVINIGGGQPFSLNKMNSLVEEYFGKASEIETAKKDETEALITRASTQLLEDLGLPIPKVNFESGISHVCDWAKRIPSDEFSEWLRSSE
jgi:UDP-glucuronate 4-epimerase